MNRRRFLSWATISAPLAGVVARLPWLRGTSSTGNTVGGYGLLKIGVSWYQVISPTEIRSLDNSLIQGSKYFGWLRHVPASAMQIRFYPRDDGFLGHYLGYAMDTTGAVVAYITRHGVVQTRWTGSMAHRPRIYSL